MLIHQIESDFLRPDPVDIGTARTVVAAWGMNEIIVLLEDHGLDAVILQDVGQRLGGFRFAAARFAGDGDDLPDQACFQRRGEGVVKTVCGPAVVVFDDQLVSAHEIDPGFDVLNSILTRCPPTAVIPLWQSPQCLRLSWPRGRGVRPNCSSSWPQTIEITGWVPHSGLSISSSSIWGSSATRCRLSGISDFRETASRPTISGSSSTRRVHVASAAS